MDAALSSGLWTVFTTDEREAAIFVLIMQMALNKGEAGEALKAVAETVKAAVTGDLPPIDYVAADGTAAGFNTAMLAELRKRLNVNIELVQVEAGGKNSCSSLPLPQVFSGNNFAISL